MISSSSCTSSGRDLMDKLEASSSTTINSPLSVDSTNSTGSIYDKFSNKIDSPDADSPSSTASSLKSPDSTTSVNLISTTTTTTTSTSGTYRTCKVCGDKDADRAFGSVACDSCRGFFKRVIKNSRSYACIGTKCCTLNKKTRNHCKACRLQKCYKVGMKNEAAKDFVEREKQSKLEKKKHTKLLKDHSSAEVSSSHTENPVQCIDIKEINQAELYVDPKINNFANIAVDPIRQLCLAADKQLASLAEWAKRLPFFTTLTLADQVKLLQWNWAELLIGGFCYRSSAVSDGILLATGLHLSRDNLQKAGVGTLVNKLFSEVINKMQGLQINVSEWGCLRAIMLFAPDTKDLTEIDKVESIRERYVATLCDHVKKNNTDDPDRLGHLLLRLPPLKAIALQVIEHLFFFKLIGDVPIDTFLLEMLDVDSH